MCLGYKVLYRLLPLRVVRAMLIRRHFADCTRCREGFRSADRAVLELEGTPPSWIEREPSLWPSIRTRILELQAPPKKKIPRSDPAGARTWRWAVAGLGLALVVSFNLLIRRTQPLTAAAREITPTKAASDVSVNYAEIQGRKARHYIYQTPTKSFIWFVRDKDSGGE